MGMDLTLLPVECDCGAWGYAHTMLELDRDYGLHGHIQALSPQPLLRPFDLSSFRARVPDGSLQGGSCYGVVSETPYGCPLTYTKAKALVTAFDEASSLSAKNRAARAYLAELSGDTLVALYWH